MSDPLELFPVSAGVYALLNRIMCRTLLRGMFVLVA